jgi:hypothetical protein
MPAVASMLTIVTVAIFSGGRRGRSEPEAGRRDGEADQGESSSWPGHDAGHGHDVRNAGGPESGWGAGAGQGSGPAPHGMRGFNGGPVDPSFAGPAFAGPDSGRREGAVPGGGYAGRGPAPDGSPAGYWHGSAPQDNARHQGAPGPVPGSPGAWP